MLPPFIIEQIRKREEDEKARHEQVQPRVDIPLPRPRLPMRPAEDDEPGRGVLILDI
jgi:hypothetical protein